MAHERIEMNPDILVGKPVIKGTRISVEFILDLLAAGRAIDEIVDDYGITVDDIEAAKSFAVAHLPAAKATAAE